MAGMIPLIKARVLYLGSCVPLQTSVGLEAIQEPLKDRYGGVGGNKKVSGIDGVLTVFSGGMLLQALEDSSAPTWFPIQSLHLCCSVAPQGHGSNVRFVPINNDCAGTEPPIFSAITRRSKGIKILECHAFMCRKVEICLALTQSCTHAFSHKEGWLEGEPSIAALQQAASKLVPAEFAYEKKSQSKDYQMVKNHHHYGHHHHGHHPHGHHDHHQSVVVVPPQEQAPVVQVINPPPQTLPAPASNVYQFAPSQSIPAGYFSNWKASSHKTVMLVANSPITPKQYVVEETTTKKKKKKKCDKVEYFIMKRDNLEEEEEQDDDDDDGVSEDDNVVVIYPKDQGGYRERENSSDEDADSYDGNSYGGYRGGYDDGYRGGYGGGGYDYGYGGGYGDGGYGGGGYGGYDDGYGYGGYDGFAGDYLPEYFDGMGLTEYPQEYRDYYSAYM